MLVLTDVFHAWDVLSHEKHADLVFRWSIVLTRSMSAKSGSSFIQRGVLSDCKELSRSPTATLLEINCC